MRHLPYQSQLCISKQAMFKENHYLFSTLKTDQFWSDPFLWPLYQLDRCVALIVVTQAFTSMSSWRLASQTNKDEMTSENIHPLPLYLHSYSSFKCKRHHVSRTHVYLHRLCLSSYGRVPAARSLGLLEARDPMRRQ